MKIKLRYLVLLAALVELLFPVLTLADVPYKLVIAPMSAQFTTGAPILVKLQIINVSSAKIRGGGRLDARNHAERDYRIRVWYEDGRVAQLTSYGKDVENPASEINSEASLVGKDLYPGEQYEEYTDISTVFSITEPGVYYVQAETKGVEAKSNLLTITVK